MVAKIVKLAAVPAGLVISSYGLYAASDREPKGHPLSPHKLSVYSAPPRESRFIEESPGRVQRSFSAVRSTLSPLVIWGKNAGDAVRAGVVETIRFAQDSYVYLKNPPPEFLPRVGVITVSGLAGLILSRKGSRLRRVAYPAGLTALGASVCYPAQAVIFAKVSGKKLYHASHWTYDSVRSLWKAEPQMELSDSTPADNKEKPQREETTSETKSTAEKSTAEEPIRAEHAEPPNTQEGSTESVPPAAVKQSVFIAPPGLTDHGQSNPEDVDMYSTRS